MSKKVPVSIAHGDGIGPEIMEATLHILQEAGASIELEEVALGEKVYLKGITNGIDPSAWESLRRTRCLLKAPMTTPQGGGYKSLNVTLRTTLGLYANIRPCVSYHPYIATKHPNMNVVIVRENEEDLYIGIEYQQTPQTTECIKLITRPGSEKIIDYAFNYARNNGRKKVTCFVKDNIMKLTDGLFHRIFDEVAKNYSDIQADHWIVDIGTAKLADTPEQFDVIVVPNLYGDIISDVAAQIAGSVGLAGSANIGDHGAMFEAIHGSAPRRAGQNVANPSGLLMAAIMMLVHIGQSDVAENVHNAWLRTIEEGTHTYDIFKEGISRKQVGTKEFGVAVAKNLGKKPEKLTPVTYKRETPPHKPYKCSVLTTHKTCAGIDVFVEHAGSIEDLVAKVRNVSHTSLTLKEIYNRGTRVWPETHPETYCVDQWRLRYLGKEVPAADLVALLERLVKGGIDVVKTENLYNFDGKPAYSGAT